MKISQGAQTTAVGEGATDRGLSHMMSGGLAYSPLGTSTNASAVGASSTHPYYDVWASTHLNNELYGLGGELQSSRNGTRGLMQQLQSRLPPMVEGTQEVSHSTSVITDEIAARAQRLKDLSESEESLQPRVHQHWANELAHLSVDHDRWREAAAVERYQIRSTVTDVAPHKAPAVGGLDSNALREAVKLRPLTKSGYVSPSIQKLGLTTQLNRQKPS
jgi:hypothetical protein